MSVSDNRFRLFAEAYAGKMGLPIFPCVPNGKAPATPRGFHDASKDPSRVAEWWQGESAYNVAIATGNGLVVLDVDIDHERGKYGDETLAVLEWLNGPLPDTWMCLTGGGGVHYYFRCDDPKLTTGVNFAPGLDYRGAGGYVIAPPSIHESGRRYEWEAAHTPTSLPLAPLPDWLHRLMLGVRSPRPQRSKGKRMARRKSWRADGMTLCSRWHPPSGPRA